MEPSSAPVSASSLVLVLDLCGTFVFALSGATAGVRERLDLLGVLVLSFAAGNFGGILRDMLIGATPPPAVADWRYVAVAMTAGLATFRWARHVERLQRAVQIFDAAGLGLFAVSGAEKALDFHLGPVGAVLLGMLSGVGGGIVRDVLTAQVPAVLRADIYAVAALVGAAVVVVGRAVHMPAPVATVVGMILCFGLRLVSIRRGWQLPLARGSEHRGAGEPRRITDSKRAEDD